MISPKFNTFNFKWEGVACAICGPAKWLFALRSPTYEHLALGVRRKPMKSVRDATQRNNKAICGCGRDDCDLVERERRLSFIKRIGRVQSESNVCDWLPHQNHTEHIFFQINTSDMHIHYNSLSCTSLSFYWLIAEGSEDKGNMICVAKNIAFIGWLCTQKWDPCVLPHYSITSTHWRADEDEKDTRKMFLAGSKNLPPFGVVVPVSDLCLANSSHLSFDRPDGVLQLLLELCWNQTFNPLLVLLTHKSDLRIQRQL